MNKERTNGIKDLLNEIKDMAIKCWLLIVDCWNSFTIFGKCTIAIPLTLIYSFMLVVVVSFFVFIGFCGWLFFKEEKIDKMG